MNFGEAIEALKQGKLVARKGWNGKGMFVYMQQTTVSASDTLPEPVEKWFNKHIVIAKDDPGINVSYSAHLCMKAADDTIVVGWLASQTDILSNDWDIVES